MAGILSRISRKQRKKAEPIAEVHRTLNPTSTHLSSIETTSSVEISPLSSLVDSDSLFMDTTASSPSCNIESSLSASSSIAGLQNPQPHEPIMSSSLSEPSSETQGAHPGAEVGAVPLVVNLPKESEQTDDVDLMEITVSALGFRTRQLLSMYLNPPKLTGSDWRGLADYMDSTQLEIDNFALRENPTVEVLRHWESCGNRTIGELVRFLHDLEREDALAALEKPISIDAERWMKKNKKPDGKPLQVAEVSGTSYPNQPLCPELRGITLNDHPDDNLSLQELAIWVANLEIGVNKITKINKERCEITEAVSKNKEEDQDCRESATYGNAGITDFGAESGVFELPNEALGKEHTNVWDHAQDDVVGAYHHYNTIGRGIDENGAALGIIQTNSKYLDTALKLVHLEEGKEVQPGSDSVLDGVEGACYHCDPIGRGIDEDEAALGIIKTNSRFLDTALKLVHLEEGKEVQPGSADSSFKRYLTQIGTVLKSAIAYNQRTYQALFIASKSVVGMSGIRQQGRESFLSQIFEGRDDYAHPSATRGLYERRQRISSPPQLFDAYICHNSNTDYPFVMNILDIMEKPPYNLKLCTDWRDLVPGGAYAKITAELIENRCKRMIVVLSPEFLDSENCDFHIKFALSLSPGARSRRMVLVMLKPCEPPNILRFITVCDYTREALRPYFWPRLYAALNLS